VAIDMPAGSAIVLNPYYPGSPNQQWERADPFIRNRATPNKVLDIAGEYNYSMWEQTGTTAPNE